MVLSTHSDPEIRERILARYLARTLDASAAEAFESHYLECDDCFEEVRASELLIWSLREPALESVLTDNIVVIRFKAATQLVHKSPELSALMRIVDQRGDTNVLIDLEKVERIDSTGLGALMQCYTHAVRNAGALKLLQPAPQVKRVLALTKIDTVVPTFEDEDMALRSFA